VYLGHVIGEGELKIDPAKTKTIFKWPTRSNFTKVGNFARASQYLISP
jgi:hypothetical protein